LIALRSAARAARVVNRSANPFRQRWVSGLGAKVFQRDLPRLSRRLLSLDEIRLFKTGHRFSTLYFNLARAAVARRI
jgi:hypothetical protein